MKAPLCTTLFIVIAAVLLFGADSASAAVCPVQIVPQCDWEAGQTYGLGAFTQIVINILRLIWCIIGAIALAMFVVGGFWWLTARGEEQQIKQGWDTLINAFIGVVIVLGSWVIINTIILAVTSPGEWKVAEIFTGEKWNAITTQDTICVQIAARRVGVVPVKDGEFFLGGPLPGPGGEGPPDLQPSPIGPPPPIWESDGISLSNPELFDINIPVITPEEGGSAQPDPALITPNLAPSEISAFEQLMLDHKGDLLMLSLTLATLPVGGLLAGIGSKFVISGARVNAAGTAISLRGATARVVGCNRTPSVCQNAASQITAGVNNATKVDFVKEIVLAKNKQGIFVETGARLR